ncbi:LpxL/LpxP family Kdo(2)-lipid IV(A) lauroyl/palmitoleoyl acyltransferase [Anaerobiospirillum thomasii]|uniref:Lipid A biosynthesis acyltransferase n=1 Tax=Anaerobiospirillum thomasii TaxID=179995 RepID=A0A2X0V538_9GAMM|nr:LpxL/LpxP family Kdo(2)-lipid IV(A) lauroyl/palmitoleoyl acyltransferase [Anaerobiospirillum thomasii]SPT69629.1 Lipid A biosynthesis lauroyl acyltransferase [Anaerobiospirillum thomasii]
MSDKKKIQLHTSYEKRAKSHRNTISRNGWGKGATSQAKFELRMLHPVFWGSWAAIITLYLCVTLLPYRAILGLGRTVGHLMQRFMKSRAYVLERNMDLAFPDMDKAKKDKLIHDIFENSGMALFETGIAWFWSDKRLLKLAHIDENEQKKACQLAAANTRTLVFTCHFVTLEIMARLYALLIKPGVGVYRASDHPVWEYIQVRGRLRSNLALIDRSDPRSMIKALMQGHPIWYAPDQDYGIKASVFVPFFGVDKAATVTGTHDLAKVKGVIVQPAFTIRKADGYHLYVKDALENFPGEDEVFDTARCNKILEDIISMAPEQYLWMHRRFKTAPEGEMPRYPDIS